MKLFVSIIIITILNLSSSLAKSKSQNSFDRHPSAKVSDPVVSLPVNEEVCFSPEMNCDQKLVKLIQSAQKSIDLAIFDITLDQVVHEILVKSKKIPVRIVVDRRQSKGPHSLVSTLLKAKANVRYGKQRGIMHNKFIIVDGKILQTGSFNYTNGAAFKNEENQIYLTAPKVLKIYQDRFEVIWQKSKEK